MVVSLRRRVFLSPNSSIIFMGFKHFVPRFNSTTSSLFTAQTFSSSQDLIFNSITSSRNRLINVASSSSLKHVSPIYQQMMSSAYATMSIATPIPDADKETLDDHMADQKQLMVLRKKLVEVGVDGSACMPGQFSGLVCPNASADVKSIYGRRSKFTKAKQPIRKITDESLGLEPLGNELLAYFSKRMISGETLRRNAVMQKKTRNQIVIAFTYQRNNVLVSCNYRHITKKFWKEAQTEEIYYGLDDIKEASEIIIVEGEMDKLAMEEAGFQNCVSVPHGAPPKVANKSLPSEEEDANYRYVWNCKEYTEKASRIILATDGDPPGHALAEELAQRLGRERCWRVEWPKKNDAENCEDANEVLMHVGPDALRAAIENAELYG